MLETPAVNDNIKIWDMGWLVLPLIDFRLQLCTFDSYTILFTT